MKQDIKNMNKEEYKNFLNKSSPKELLSSLKSNPKELLEDMKNFVKNYLLTECNKQSIACKKKKDNN